MKKFFAVTTALCLVLGFQNCSQSNLNGDVLSVSANPYAPSSEKGGEVVNNVSLIEIPNADQAQTGTQAKAADLSPSRLVISPQTGVIQLMDDANAVLDEKCLSAADLNELNTILSGSSICSASATESEICGMVYKPAYASLMSNNALVNLGEELDSCGNGRKDLCGELATVFQNYVSHIKAHYQEMNCQ